MRRSYNLFLYPHDFQCFLFLFLSRDRLESHFQQIFILIEASWRRFFSKFSEDVFKTSSRRLQHVFETYFEDYYLQKNLPRSHFWEIYDQWIKFPTVKKISQVLVFQYTTPLVAAYRGVFRTWLNIYNELFWRKYLTALSC